MATFLLATLTASVVGSVHCAGMCGPFVLMATGTENRLRRLAAYHLGRLVSYSALGVVAGSAGAALDLTGASLGLQRAGAAVAGALLIVFGLIALVRALGGRLPHAVLPRPLQRLVQSGHRRVRTWPATARAAAIGLLSALLPCGWLFLFVLAAAGTGSPVTGGLVTAAFWLGTLPLLTAFAAGVTRLSGRFRSALPVATAVLCLLAGGHTLFVRTHADLTTLRPVPNEAAGSPEAQAATLRSLPERPLPCCHAR
ncbi:MAG TPA: sulfite exporter TauE/SafE family protein [Planctomycetaceae bacterium]